MDVTRAEAGRAAGAGAAPAIGPLNGGNLSRQQLLDLYFLEARARLIDVAAFLDRLERGWGPADFRLEAFKRALNELQREGGGRTEGVLRSSSDPTLEPIPAATSQAACGAWPDHP